MPFPRFPDILGQPRALAIMQSALETRRAHHAWILHGPQGVGKFTTALAFAGALLDPTTAPNLSGAIEPDEDSETQRLLAREAHPDLHIIRKELALYSRDEPTRKSKQTTISIEVAREFLIEPASRTSMARPGALAGKVFIVDEADMLAAPAQNALLKTLEEPAPGTIIILVTSSPEGLLPTIRSRCQRIAFESLPGADLEHWLARWLKDSGATLDKAERAWILDHSGGSPGWAAIAIQGKFFQWAEKLDPMLADADEGRFTVEMGSTLATLVNDWAKARVDEQKNASKDAANKAGARHMFALLAEHARRSLRAAATLNRDRQGAASELNRDREGADPESIHDPALERSARTIDFIAEAERHLDSNVNMTLLMENLAARMAGA